MDKINEVNDFLETEFALEFREFSSEVAVDFEEIQEVTEYIGGEVYAGDYKVTPKVTAQTMPTKDKVMLDDVTVEAIPFYEVKNTSGGKTATIG